MIIRTDMFASAHKMLLIDSDNYFASGIEIIKFPGGEFHVKLSDMPEDVGRINLFVKPRSWDDFGKAILVYDALRNQSLRYVNFFMPYFPGARQDRSDGTTPFTARVIAQIVKSTIDQAVYVLDPHSDTLKHLLPFARFIMPTSLDAPELKSANEAVGIIAPDAGAVARARMFRDKFAPKAVLIECLKHRDFKTGRLSGYLMPPLPEPGHYIVVDDICDGGGTFNLLASAFSQDKHYPNSSLELFVSHGIFSKGIQALSEVYSTITTTNSWCTEQATRLRVIKLEDHIERIVNA